MNDALAIDEATVVIESAPTQHTRRYDRQLRLWAASGQHALEKSHVLVINATPTACQALKNIVLPGVGRFVILDDTKVTKEESLANFFLESTSVGCSRAHETLHRLLALNDAVRGEIVLDMSKMHDARWLSQFNLVLAFGLQHQEETALAKTLWALHIPLIVTHTSGLIGSVRSQFHEQCVVDTHLDSRLDLYITRPFEALREYALGIDLDKMDSFEHGHVPFVIILIQVLEKWKKEHGNLPIRPEDRKAFKALIREKQTHGDEENFEEAMEQVSRAWADQQVPKLEKLFKQLETRESDLNEFWILIKALKRFHDTHGRTPVDGRLPDMKASTEQYTALQRVYRDQASLEKEEFRKLVQEECQKAGAEDVSQETISNVIKNAATLTCISGRSIEQERENPNSESLRRALGADEEDIPSHMGAIYWFIWYILKQSEPQTTTPSNIDTQVEHLLSSLHDQLGQWGLPTHPILPKALTEILRGNHQDLPAVSGILGGIIGQEAIKLLTHQYIPLSGTMIWDGVFSRTHIIHV